MARKYVNITQVARPGRAPYYRARYFPPFDKELGLAPKPIDFHGATKEEADRKRAAYEPESVKMFGTRKSSEFVSVYIAAPS
jgi:hypothetical protein